MVVTSLTRPAACCPPPYVTNLPQPHLIKPAAAALHSRKCSLETRSIDMQLIHVFAHLALGRPGKHRDERAPTLRRNVWTPPVINDAYQEQHLMSITHLHSFFLGPVPASSASTQAACASSISGHIAIDAIAVRELVPVV